MLLLKSAFPRDGLPQRGNAGSAEWGARAPRSASEQPRSWDTAASKNIVLRGRVWARGSLGIRLGVPVGSCPHKDGAQGKHGAARLSRILRAGTACPEGRHTRRMTTEES